MSDRAVPSLRSRCCHSTGKVDVTEVWTGSMTVQHEDIIQALQNPHAVEIAVLLAVGLLLIGANLPSSTCIKDCTSVFAFVPQVLFYIYNSEMQLSPDSLLVIC